MLGAQEKRGGSEAIPRVLLCPCSSADPNTTSAFALQPPVGVFSTTAAYPESRETVSALDRLHFRAQ
jgi:hypothetical protein